VPERLGLSGKKDMTEIIGSSGSGKTELLMLLAANCILPAQCDEIALYGNNVGVIFLDLDCRFPMSRFAKMLAARIAFYGQEHLSEEVQQRILQESLERFFLIQCLSASQLQETLERLPTWLRTEHNIRLLLIDNITAFHWTERAYGASAATEMYARLTGQLVKLCENFQLKIVCTRQALRAGDPTGKDLLARDWLAAFPCRLSSECLPDGKLHHLKVLSAPDATSSFCVGDCGVAFDE
jgi:RecA/RadA recombinase